MKKIVFFIGFVIAIMTVNAQWSNDPAVNTLISAPGVSGNTLTKTVQTSDDMMYVSYTSGGLGFKTKLQLVDKDGKGVWPNGGILLSNHLAPTYTTDYTLCISPDDCAVVIFSDSRNDPEGHTFHPYVYKINKAGEFLWGLDGVKVPYEGKDGLRPRMCATNAGNVVVGFTDATNSQVTFAKFSADGQVMWSGLTIQYASMVNFAPSGADGFILTYYLTQGDSAQLYAQRYNGNGEPIWGEPVAIDATGRISSYNEPYITSDGADGILALYGIAISNSEMYVMLQRVSKDGDLLMGLEGVKCSDTYEIHSSGQFSVDLERGEIFVFETCYQSSQDRGLRVNKFDMFGETLWDSEGVAPVDKQFWGYMTNGVAPTGDGGAILIFENDSSAVLSTLVASKVEIDGSFRWKDVPLCSVENKISDVVCSPFFNNQVCVFWGDVRNGGDGTDYGQIYGQNISGEGKLGVIGVGVNELNNSSVSIYPNPAKDVISIKCETGSIETVMVSDMSGRVVMDASSCGSSIDVSSLKAGVYVVNTVTSEGSSVNKVVIK